LLLVGTFSAKASSDHHALVGFRRMARDGHGVVAIDAAVHVGDLNVGFVDVALMAMKVRERRGL